MNLISMTFPITPKYSKMLYYIIFSATIFLCFYQTHLSYDYSTKPGKTHVAMMSEIVKVNQEHKLKYILLWTHPEDTPFVYFGEGTSVFENKTCHWSNCYVTGDRNFLGDYAKFNVIAFSSSRLSQMSEDSDLPVRRSVRQKYVFASVESAAYYPICTDKWNGFFNWSWTYKLNSNAVWGYINIRNATGHVIGPKPEMHWIDPLLMEEIDDNFKSKLSSKTRVAAWFVSNCNTLSLREELVKEIDFQLKQYKLSVDIYGNCGKNYCPKKIMSRCLKILEKDYFFYFSFENSFSEDYVTEKLMYPLLHNTVPVVYGGANYSRFLPTGSYLDARQMGPAKLAHKMFELSNDPKAYARYFKWKKYYSYHYRYESPDTDDYCRFCAMLNDERLVKTTSNYKDIKFWWSDTHKC